MKRLLSTSLLCSAVLGLAACSSAGLGNFADAPPYADERTAVHVQNAPAPAPAPVAAPAPAPVVQQCDTSAWESRVVGLEKELAQCREASSRVRAEFRDDLRK